MAVEQFWNELLTKESWEKLVELAREYDFILIGGWASYLWTKMHKSKDIDVVVDYGTLKKLGEKFEIRKNQRLHKYEIRFDKFDVDIYLPFFSKLAIPPEELTHYTAKIEGITTVTPEALLVLKQAAEIDRRGSVKGRKDAIDILSLMIRAKISWKEYKGILKSCKLEHYLKELENVIHNCGDDCIPYLGMGFMEFKRWKRQALEEMRKMR